MQVEISERVKQLNNMLCEIDNIYQALLLNKGLSDSEYVVMFAILALGEGCLQKDICENSFINKKTINSTIKKLEREGYIKLKAGKYPNLHIYLTNEGKAFIEKTILPIINFETSVLDGIPEEEFLNFITTYSKYVQVFKDRVAQISKK